MIYNKIYKYDSDDYSTTEFQPLFKSFFQLSKLTFLINFHIFLFFLIRQFFNPKTKTYTELTSPYTLGRVAVLWVFILLLLTPTHVLDPTNPTKIKITTRVAVWLRFYLTLNVIYDPKFELITNKLMVCDKIQFISHTLGFLGARATIL